MTQAATARIRKDPKQRQVSGQGQTLDGTPRWTFLHNKREDRVYVMVYKAGSETNQITRYLELGYEVETWGDPKDPNRLRFGAGKGSLEAGTPMEYQGHVVMSIDKATHQQMVQEGDGQGGMGQGYADLVERAIRRGTGVHNPLRGRRGVFGDKLRLKEFDSSDGRYEELRDGDDFEE